MNKKKPKQQSKLIIPKPIIDYFYYSYEIISIDSFSNNKNKKQIEHYMYIKAANQKEAEDKIQNTYLELNLPIIKLKLLSVEKV